MSLSTIRKMTLRLNMEEPKQAEQQRYITAEELEQIKKELREELLEEARRELLKLLGQYAAGTQNPIAGQRKAVTEQTDEMELENDTEGENSVVGNLACRWMGEI